MGVHSTQNLDDGYLGSGKVLRRAIKKYGIENFTKKILEYFDNVDDLLRRESEIVNETFIQRSDTYNIKLGGSGGWDYINKNQLGGFSQNKDLARSGRYKTNMILKEKYGENWNSIVSKMGQPKAKEALKHKYASDELFRQHLTEAATKGRIAALSPEARNKQKETFSNIGHQQGAKNSQFGKQWMYHPDKKISKSIPKSLIDEFINDGWIKGRKLKF